MVLEMSKNVSRTSFLLLNLSRTQVIKPDHKHLSKVPKQQLDEFTVNVNKPDVWTLTNIMNAMKNDEDRPFIVVFYLTLLKEAVQTRLLFLSQNSL